MAAFVINGRSREDIEAKIDSLLERKPNVRNLLLILPIAGSAYRYSYKNFTIRVWSLNGQTRLDAAYEEPDNASNETTEDRNAPDVVHDPASRGSDPA